MLTKISEDSTIKMNLEKESRKIGEEEKMGKKKTKNKRNSELKIIFFIILIALMLFIVSTYAWFSTQRNVSITNLSGIVEVAEGLEISLDAETWYNGIVIGSDKDAGELDIVADAYSNNRNLVPRELLPVSTLGLTATSPNGMTDLRMLRGKVTDTKKLSEIALMLETNSTLATTAANYELLYPGYFAFDIFLKNSSKTDTDDPLQLNYDSSLQIMSSELADATQAAEEKTNRAATGLQNTVRVALAKYGTAETGVTDVNAEQSEILEITGAKDNNVAISDVAIWEPNASDHVDYIVKNNNNITWSTADKAKTEYGLTTDENGKTKFATTSKIPTYALTDNAITLTTINDIYDWSGTNNTTLQKQTTLQTTKKSVNDYTIAEGVQNLISTNGGDKFTIPANSICRLRVYIWLEGQDVDCINYASHGGGIELDLGLVKGSTVGSKGEADAEATE